tara:strand:- start:95 stop:616 length:522 start_codon:yes stop_codon:yes gene_type:complete
MTEEEKILEKSILKIIHQKRKESLLLHSRHQSISDLFSDRWETAEFMGFGKGSSCYNNVLIIGDVKVGENCWIGPNVILDGSGGLTLGDYVSISAGAQVYTHDTVEWSVSLGKSPIKRKQTVIGDGVYIGPNAIIQMGVTIGDKAVVGAQSLVQKNVSPGAKFYGNKIFTDSG